MDNIRMERCGNCHYYHKNHEPKNSIDWACEESKNAGQIACSQGYLPLD